MAERLSKEELFTLRDASIGIGRVPRLAHISRAVDELLDRRQADLSSEDKVLLCWALSHTAANSVDDAEVARLRALLVRLGAVEEGS